MISFKQTIAYIRMDINRRATLESRHSRLSKSLMLFRRGMAGVILYRLARYSVLHNHTLVARFLVTLHYFYSRNEVSPWADLGPGLVFADAGMMGLTHVSVAGKNCTFLGCNTLSLGAIEGIDQNKERIVLGDHCVLGARTRLMRAVNLADGTQVMDGSVVLLPTTKIGSTVAGIPAKRIRLDDYEKIKQWNPLMGGMIVSKGAICGKR